MVTASKSKYKKTRTDWIGIDPADLPNFEDVELYEEIENRHTQEDILANRRVKQSTRDNIDAEYDRALHNKPENVAARQAARQAALAQETFNLQKRYYDEQISHMNEQRAKYRSEQEAAAKLEQEQATKLQGRNRRRLALIETSNEGVLGNAPTGRRKILGN